MRSSLVALIALLATVLTATPALGRERTLLFEARHVNFGTVTAPESGTTSDAILITNLSDQPIAMSFATSITVPSDWSQDYLPFIVEDALLLPNWESCNEIPPGATCPVFVTFQTDRPGMFAGWLVANGTRRDSLRALAVAEGQ